MLLYHATPKRNLESIHQHGLDPAFSKGKRKEIYLHTAGRRAWAILHTARRHRIPAEDVVLLKVSIPRSKLTRRYRGLWSTGQVITNWTEIDTSEIAASPLE